MPLPTILEVAKRLGVPRRAVKQYGVCVGKIDPTLVPKRKKQGRLVLVTAITPTPAGEGKTTTSIGLSMALNSLGKKSVACLREPSLGPIFGMKGGATGGGKATVEPHVDINFQFTGDLPAVAVANNLLSALIDNELYRGTLGLKPEQVVWRRCLDMNDRALREARLALSKKRGLYRTDRFQITAASEVMAVLALAKNRADLKKRLGRMVIGWDRKGKPVKAHALKSTGALAALLREALKPNLVQTSSGTPAFIHAGPFANIAHGCSSLIATRLALATSDWVVTEAGFGSELGMEKFFDIVCRQGQLKTSAVVLVATVRALRAHGKAKNFAKPNHAAVKRGLKNLALHVENVKRFGFSPVVALNVFQGDTNKERGIVRRFVERKGLLFAESLVYQKGAKGGKELAKAVLKAAVKPKKPRYLYALNAPLKDKISSVAENMYNAKASFTQQAKKQLARLEKAGFGKMAVCIAKTQKAVSAPPGKLAVEEAYVSAGAGFVVARSGSIFTMPGLPSKPAAQNITVDAKGHVLGV